MSATTTFQQLGISDQNSDHTFEFISSSEKKCKKNFSICVGTLSGLGAAAFGTIAFIGTTLPICSITLSIVACVIVGLACSYVFIRTQGTMSTADLQNGTFHQTLGQPKPALLQFIRSKKQQGEGNEGTVEKIYIITTSLSENTIKTAQAALKTYKEFVTDSESDENFSLEEARQSRRDLAAMKLSSPYLIKTFGCEFKNQDQKTYISKVLMETASDAQSLQNASIEASDKQRLGKEIAMGVCAMHQAKLIHRDLKPENVLIIKGEDGQQHAKILDFGFTRELKEQDKFRLTDCGSLLNMAPERFARPNQGIEAHLKSDVFGLGTILYFMEFNEVIPRDQSYRIKNSDLTTKLKQLEGSNPNLKEVLEKALTTKDYETQRPTIKQLLKLPSQRPTIEQLLKLPYFTSTTPAQIGGAE